MWKNLNPYYLLAGVAGVGFVVWLFSSMARTGYANRILLTLLVCFAVVGLVGGLSLVRGSRRQRER